MKRVLDFYGFYESDLVKESIKVARDYAIKKYVEKRGIKLSDLSDVEREKITHSKEMNVIKELTDNMPGYAPLFAIFHYDQDASPAKLRELKNEMIKYKRNMSDLPMPPMEYAKIKLSDKNTTPGYQKLIDDLAKIELKIKLRKLYKSFTFRMRNEFKKATPEQIDKLTQISNQLDKLPDETAVLPNGEKVTRNAWRSFTKNLLKYDDLENYPDFSDPEVAFAELISDAENLVNTWGLGLDDIVNRLVEAGPQAGIIYVGNGYIVLSARTVDALQIVAGSTTWCIRNQEMFKQIVGTGNLQLCLLNTNLSSVDNMSLIGLTVDSLGNIIDNADRENRPIWEASGTKYYDFMLRIGYPDAAISATRDQFKNEVQIKSLTDTFIGFKDYENLNAITSNLISRVFGAKAVFTNVDSSRMAYRILGEIISKVHPGVINIMIMEYRDHGICSNFSLSLFKNIFSQYCKKSDIEAILSETKYAKEDSETIIKKSDRFPAKIVSQARIIIDAADAAIEYLRDFD